MYYQLHIKRIITYWKLPWLNVSSSRADVNIDSLIMMHKSLYLLSKGHWSVVRQSAVLFIFEREWECTSCRERGGRRVGERKRGRESLKQNSHSVWSPARSSVPQLWDHSLSQNRESYVQLTEPPLCPKIYWTLHSFIRGDKGPCRAFPHILVFQFLITSIINANNSFCHISCVKICFKIQIRW